MIVSAKPDCPLPTIAKFQPGQLVHHRRYDYRGVVVGSDPDCQAIDEWYYANCTQPNRYQHWYHVLVDRRKHTTYVAEENLEPDPLGLPVSHPMLEVFFTRFEKGRYERNETPWPINSNVA